MVMDYRSSAGYTPLDFAFVVAGSKGQGVIEMLDSDRQLLPRNEDPALENNLLEVWKHLKVIRCTYYIILPCNANFLRPQFIDF